MSTSPASVSSTKRSGRKPTAVWEYFTAIRTDSNKLHGKCNFCGYRCAGVASRMAHHLLSKCATAPKDLALPVVVDPAEREPKKRKAATTTESDAAVKLEKQRTKMLTSRRRLDGEGPRTTPDQVCYDDSDLSTRYSFF